MAMLKGMAIMACIVVATAFQTSPFSLDAMATRRAMSLRPHSRSRCGGLRGCGGDSERKSSGILGLACNSQASSGQIQDLKSKLRNICSTARQGVDGYGKSTKQEFDALVEEICALNPTPDPARSPLMGGRWELAWTTEKEVTFLIEKGLFWDKCLSVYQTIDTSEPSLQNALDFENDGYLKVNSSFQPREEEGEKFDFKFKTLGVKWRQFEVQLPPLGEGWGSQVFLDSTLRIQKDSRGDVSIYYKSSGE